ncbi:hypothetical protein BLOT_012222 [Blomia tropicalis]|nr:hypothetical protein BLOT_012222 [Blomia tropicalis]
MVMANVCLLSRFVRKEVDFHKIDSLTNIGKNSDMGEKETMRQFGAYCINCIIMLATKETKQKKMVTRQHAVTETYRLCAQRYICYYSNTFPKSLTWIMTEFFCIIYCITTTLDMMQYIYQFNKKSKYLFNNRFKNHCILLCFV